MNLYRTLELNENANLDEIKKSYRRLARIYHPDKNKDPSANNKFLEISTAYEILSNDKSRVEYSKLPDLNKNKFQEFLSNIFGHNIDLDSLSNFGINLSKKEISKLQLYEDVLDILKKLDLNEIFTFFKDGVLPNKDFNSMDNNICSDSDVECWDVDDANYYDSLPIIYRKYKEKNLNIIQDIPLSQLLKGNKISLSIKRKFGSEFIVTKFNFSVSSQWVVFNGGGDFDESPGDLIIRLNLPKSFDWQGDIILYQKDINLYEYVYGLRLDLDHFGDIFKNKDFKFIDWIPSREGNIIFLNEIKFKVHFKIAIKLVVKVKDSDYIKNILRENFKH